MQPAAKRGWAGKGAGGEEGLSREEEGPGWEGVAPGRACCGQRGANPSGSGRGGLMKIGNDGNILWEHNWALGPKTWVIGMATNEVDGLHPWYERGWKFAPAFQFRRGLRVALGGGELDECTWRATAAFVEVSSSFSGVVL